MLETTRARRGMVTASHHLAAEAGLAVLREGGNAIEAMIAAAATISVVYPHMNGLGGDGFWLISADGAAPAAIQGVGASGAAVTPALYRQQGLDSIPVRGPLAANTVAGTVSSWQAALEISAAWGGRLPLARLFADAIHYAESGFPISNGQHANTRDKQEELAEIPGFADLFLVDGAPPRPGATFRNPALAGSLRHLAEAGLDDFYRGRLAATIAADLARAGSPLTAADLAAHRSARVTPLALRLRDATVYNHPPPTQGLASLMILGLFERLGCKEAEGFHHLHGLIEATRLAFAVRDAEITDPAHMRVDPGAYLTAETLDRLAATIDMERTTERAAVPRPGDTVWLGAVDGAGRTVSFIHSIYWEFGSGVVLAESGITWQNRGASFALDGDAANPLAPGRLPFHTNNPAMARFDDGRIMAYGTMGGDGQPQTQAALFTRYARFEQELQRAVTAPRWLLGRTWGERTSRLRIEPRVGQAVLDALRLARHDVEIVDDFNPLMGHAGAVVRHPSGLIEGAADPRDDGRAAGF